MDIVGYGARVAVERGTWVLRFRDAGDTARPAAGDGFFSSLHDGHGGVVNQAVLIEDGRAALDRPSGGGLTLVSDPDATHQGWRIDHGGWSCRWPSPLSILADRPDAPWKALEFHHEPHDVLINVQGPVPNERVPPPDGLVSHGQTMTDLQVVEDQLWVEVAYVHDGHAWRQRHQYAPLGGEQIMLLRGQAPDGRHEAAWRAVDELARSFAPGRPTAPSTPKPTPSIGGQAGRRAWFGRRR